ncbi:glycosyltransferase family 2 protein [Butyrivibrio sp. FC2001]|uniref:glycosyltransferase family 2 protein n=1 Tax=Butyrivibrio sp. FC2001 TaxID=1280671 RepID=UPI00040614D3|nr:glycosyltransferase family 2 protein [Butyrivibrio sp. FC2001]
MASVSIIVPVYNQEKYLNKCLDSILEQTYSDYECILVDDGATDKSPQICDEYAGKDERIRVIHKPNGGLTSARKAGFDVCVSDYVCFLDSDDYLHPDFLKRTMVTIKESDADVCTCGHYQDADGTIITNTFNFENKTIEKELIEDEYVMPIIGKIYSEGFTNLPGYVWGRVYKRSCLSEQCFVSEREVYTEDDIFQMYLSKQIEKAVFIPDKLVYYRVNSASLTHAYRKNMWKMLKNRHLRVLEFFKDSRSSQKQQRLWASGFYAIYVTLRNAYEQNDYRAFKAEMKEMLSDELSKDILSNLPDNLLKPRQKMMVLLMKLHSYRGLFTAKKLLFKN